MPTGIVALSFAKRAEEPNPVNVKLARIVEELDDQVQQVGEETILVSQWEVALALKTPPHLVVRQADATKTDRNGKPYLDSEDVLNKAFELFITCGVTDVIVVANPFLHLPAAKAIVRNTGFTVMSYKIPGVGFDNSPLNLQWWCRGPLRFIAYLGIQVVGKLIKRDFHGIWEKPHPH